MLDKFGTRKRFPGATVEVVWKETKGCMLSDGDVGRSEDSKGKGVIIDPVPAETITVGMLLKASLGIGSSFVAAWVIGGSEEMGEVNDVVVVVVFAERWFKEVEIGGEGDFLRVTKPNLAKMPVDSVEEAVTTGEVVVRTVLMADIEVVG